MLLVFLDTETTGLNPAKHRAIEIAMKIVDSVSGQGISQYHSIIAQTAEVWAEADPASFLINGFTWEETLKGKPEKVVASEIAADLNGAGLKEKSGVFICQNPSFDRPFFTQLIGVELQEDYGWPYHWLDLASMYWAYRHLNNPYNMHLLKEKDLSKDQIAQFFGLAAEKHPHRALNGVNHLLECYNVMFRQQSSL